MSKRVWIHSDRKGLTVPANSVQNEPRRIEVRCVQCGRFLGEANARGEIAGRFPCHSCKAKTEV